MIIYSTWGDDYMDIPLAYIIFDIMISCLFEYNNSILKPVFKHIIAPITIIIAIII